MKTELGEVRGLGSAKHGAGHWWRQRVTAFGNLFLILWLILSLLRLPAFDYDVMHAWVAKPSTAIPLALIVLNTFWHFRMGLQVVVEDYQHDESRIVVMALVHIWTFVTGAIALFSILKIALGGTVS